MSRTIQSYTVEGLQQRLVDMEREIRDLKRLGSWQFDREIGPDAVLAATSSGQMLVLAATADSIASGGDYVTFCAEVYRHGFDGALSGDGQTVTWPISFAGGFIQVEWAWASYQGGGTIQIEVDGTSPGWGEVVSGAEGQTITRSRPVHIEAGQSVKVWVVQSSGAGQTANVRVSFVAPDPTGDRSIYAYAVLADGPIAYWRLNEVTGTTAADHTGNGYTGTYQGTPTLAATGVMRDGSSDTAVTFDGTTAERVDCGDVAAFEFPGTLPFTVEAWAQVSGGSGSKSVVSKSYANTDTNFDGWSMSAAISGATVTYGFGRYQGTTHNATAATAAVGDRVHLVGTFDGTTLRLYLNGVLVDSDATVVSLTATTTQLHIAASNSASGIRYNFPGTIDEVAIYDSALSAAAVSKHYRIGSQTP